MRPTGGFRWKNPMSKFSDLHPKPNQSENYRPTLPKCLYILLTSRNRASRAKYQLKPWISSTETNQLIHGELREICEIWFIVHTSLNLTIQKILKMFRGFFCGKTFWEEIRLNASKREGVRRLSVQQMLVVLPPDLTLLLPDSQSISSSSKKLPVRSKHVDKTAHRMWSLHTAMIWNHGCSAIHKVSETTGQ